MTWREFQLKTAGFFRQDKRDWERARLIAYYAYASIPETGKKVSINKFLPLGDEESEIQDWQKEMLKDAQKLAIQEAKQKKLQNG